MPTLTSTGGSYNTNTSTAQNCGYGNSLYCDEDTTTTSRATGTTLVTSTRPYPASTPTGYGDTSYTGDTLANVCPKTCNPFNPSLNFCDITSSCTTTGGGNGKYYCACRAGYRANTWVSKDFSKQFSVPGLPYV
jgi:hypothetical protein